MTPEQEEQVRRALAAAGRDGAAEEDRSVPPDVAARLDRVLAELVQDRSPSVATPTGTHSLRNTRGNAHWAGRRPRHPASPEVAERAGRRGCGRGDRGRGRGGRHPWSRQLRQ